MNFGLKIAVAYALAAAILFLSAPVFAGAQPHYPIGELLALQGKAYYVGDNGRMPMKQGDPIYMNTTLETGDDARALIMFVDNTQITLGEDAELEIDEYLFDPYDPAENKGHFNIKGAFSWVSGLISKREDPDVKINTRVGSIGIRGTEFWGGTIEDHYCVYVFDGLVNYSTNANVVALKADMGVITKDENSVFNTENWSGAKIDMAKSMVAFKNTDQIKQMLKNAQTANIAKQHDYRARMFPYKENPLRPRLKAQEDDFFSEEFEELRGQ